MSQRIAYSYVRFSTLNQGRNAKTGEIKHSIARQYELARSWCKEKNVKLAANNFSDYGVSAFKGKNKTQGKLKAFIEKVKLGKIKSGSILIVESLDRISREEASKAITMLLELINELEITVVTLKPIPVEFSKQNFDYTALQVVIAILSRAHEESSIKSYRIKETWNKKRAESNKKPLTRKCPSWLKPVEKKGKFTWKIIPEKAKIVHKIFTMANEGFGVTKIAKELNSSKIPAFRGGIWERSSIIKVLHSESTFGRFTPHYIATPEQKRMPAGAPIEKYYTPVIPKTLFESVQNKLHQRKNKSGRTGIEITNLFRGLLFWGKSDVKMRIANKGKNEGRSMYNRDDMMGASPNRPVGFSYEVFESAFLRLVEQIKTITDFDSATAEKMDSDLKDSRTELASIKERSAQFQRILASNSAELFDKASFDKLAEQHKKTIKKIADQEEALVSYRKGSTDQTKNLITQMFMSNGKEKISLRIRLQNEIAELVNRINITITPEHKGRILHAEVLFKSGNTKSFWVRREITHSGGGKTNPKPTSVFTARSETTILHFANPEDLIKGTHKIVKVNEFERKIPHEGIEAIWLSDDQVKKLSTLPLKSNPSLEDYKTILRIRKNQIKMATDTPNKIKKPGGSKSQSK